MLQSQITLLVAIAFPMLVLALYSGSNTTVIIAGLIGTFGFSLAAFGLFNVEVASGGSILTVGEFPSLALFSFALALTSFWPALTGPVELIGSAVKADDPINNT